MGKLLKISSLAGVLTLVFSGSASAQLYIPPGTGDTVSPYLNLLQNQFGNAGNGLPLYQTLVKPQIDAKRASNENNANIQQLQGQLNGARRGSSNNRHFMNYSHYYINIRP
jgi:hypothetical protein